MARPRQLYMVTHALTVLLAMSFVTLMLANDVAGKSLMIPYAVAILILSIINLRGERNG